MIRHDRATSASPLRRSGRALAVAIMVVGVLFPMTTASAAATLVVDDDGFGTAADCNSATAAYTTIQSAINAAVGGDAVFVCPGTYKEQLDIDKLLTLTGSGIGSSIVQPIATPSGATAGDLADVDIDNAASGTVIENFSFDFNGPTAADGWTNNRPGWGIVISDLTGPAVTNVTIRNNDIQMGLGAGAAGSGQGVGIVTGKNADVSGLLITGNAFHGDPTNTGTGASNGAEGIYINPNGGAGTVTITGNTFDRHLFVGISVESDKVTVTGNSVSSTVAPQTASTHGIRVNDFVGGVTYSSIVISNNAVTGFENGLRLGSGATAGSTMAVLATGNTFSNNTTAIWVREDVDVTARLNAINTGNTAGLVVLAGAGPAAGICNWWGNAAGPTNVGNPGGTGTTVSGNTTFSPWLPTASLVDGSVTATSLTAPASTVSTDCSGDGATAGTPVETSLFTPTGGAVAIAASPTTPSAGYSVFGSQVVITASPAVSPANPLVITFKIDLTAIPTGTTYLTLNVLKDGVVVPACTGVGATPNPCVGTRTAVSGDAVIPVYTTSASTWKFAAVVRPQCAGLDATIVGTTGADFIIGTTGDDVIWADAGDDEVRGYGGNDTICLGQGDDLAYGAPGNDKILGGSGDDVIYGRGGNDVIKGRSGADTLYGQDGDDILKGQGGNDILRGQAGNDILQGSKGDDTLYGGTGFDTGYGGSGSDACYAVEAASSC